MPDRRSGPCPKAASLRCAVLFPGWSYRSPTRGHLSVAALSRAVIRHQNVRVRDRHDLIFRCVAPRLALAGRSWAATQRTHWTMSSTRPGAPNRRVPGLSAARSDCMAVTQAAQPQLAIPGNQRNGQHPTAVAGPAGSYVERSVSVRIACAPDLGRLRWDAIMVFQWTKVG